MKTSILHVSPELSLLIFDCRIIGAKFVTNVFGHRCVKIHHTNQTLPKRVRKELYSWIYDNPGMKVTVIASMPQEHMDGLITGTRDYESA